METDKAIRKLAQKKMKIRKIKIQKINIRKMDIFEKLIKNLKIELIWYRKKLWTKITEITRLIGLV